MKVILVDTACDGHHVAYLSALLEVVGKDNCIVVLPEQINIACRQIVVKRDFSQKRIKDYFALIREVHKVQRAFKPDIIHFVYGDYFYRFFGFGLGIFRKVRILFTFHSVRRGRMKDISLKRLFAYSETGVVHTEALVEELHTMEIQNVVQIDYPCFNLLPIASQAECREKIGLKEDIPVLGVFGNTRKDKGLDILLNALSKVTVPFQLLIAGKAETFDENYVVGHSRCFQHNVIMLMRYLSDVELQECIQASDIVVLPYRRIFNGASGPLVEGVVRGKKVISASHGSLGQIVTTYHLGRTFDSENEEALAQAIEDELSTFSQPFDEIARRYIMGLKPEVFKERYWQLYQR